MNKSKILNIAALVLSGVAILISVYTKGYVNGYDRARTHFSQLR